MQTWNFAKWAVLSAWIIGISQIEEQFYNLAKENNINEKITKNFIVLFFLGLKKRRIRSGGDNCKTG
jgi:hypothetical protein